MRKGKFKIFQGDCVRVMESMGSGTTGVAAIGNGRNFIGIEPNACYFARAKKKLEAV